MPQPASTVIKALLENQHQELRQEMKAEFAENKKMMQEVLAKQNQLLDKLPKIIKYYIREELQIVIKGQFEEHLGKYPTKDDYYKTMTDLMGEQQTVREEQTVLSQHDVDQNDRLDRLEDIHPNFSHPI